MDLILWRHAEAFDPRVGQDDLERALTPKGQRQAERVARWLVRRLPPGTRVLASPSLRTQQTAQALGRKFQTAPALAPGHGVESLLRAAEWPHARAPVLIVGHQPTLGLTAARLLAGADQAWSVRKGGLWWLRGRERGGELQVVLHAVIGPDTL
jgi:phosphohistidine phosphatase